MKIGLSLSLCIKDIIEGRAAEKDVTVIVSNTCCHNLPDFARLHSQYAQVYWKAKPQEAWLVLRRLVEEHKLIQPRVLDPDYEHKSDPYWIDVPNFDSRLPEMPPPIGLRVNEAVREAFRDARVALRGRFE